MGAAEDAFNRRLNGLDRTGTVGIRDFDLSVVTSLGAVEYDGSDGKIPAGYYLTGSSGVCPSPGLPGVPVNFSFPEDIFSDYKLPYILVRRDDISPSMDRWQPAGIQYRAPGYGAVPFIATAPNGNSYSGFDRMEQLAQAIPFDIVYTISVKARYRGPGQRNNVNGLFQHVLRTYPPYGKVNVTDSIGDLRGYEAFNEGITNLDSVGEIQERELGFAITLRIEAELDLKDPVTVQTVKVPLTARTQRL